jgi:hypothetical protein
VKFKGYFKTAGSSGESCEVSPFTLYFNSHIVFLQQNFVNGKDFWLKAATAL